MVLSEEFVSMVYKPEDEEAIRYRAVFSAAGQETLAGAGIVYPQMVTVAQKSL